MSRKQMIQRRGTINTTSSPSGDTASSRDFETWNLEFVASRQASHSRPSLAYAMRPDDRGRKWCRAPFSVAKCISEISMLLLRSSLLVVSALTLGGCLIWAFKVAEEPDVKVIDATSGTPIPYAEVVYLACDVRDFSCSKAKLVRTKANDKGQIDIDSTRRMGSLDFCSGWTSCTNHLIAIWPPGYSVFIFNQYPESIDRRASGTKRKGIIRALREIPSDHTTNDELLNPRRELIEGKLKLGMK